MLPHSDCWFHAIPCQPLTQPPAANERVGSGFTQKNGLVANVTELNAAPLLLRWLPLVVALPRIHEFGQHAIPFIIITRSTTSFLFHLPPGFSL